MPSGSQSAPLSPWPFLALVLLALVQQLRLLSSAASKACSQKPWQAYQRFNPMSFSVSQWPMAALKLNQPILEMMNSSVLVCACPTPSPLSSPTRNPFRPTPRPSPLPSPTPSPVPSPNPSPVPRPVPSPSPVPIVRIRRVATMTKMKALDVLP